MGRLLNVSGVKDMMPVEAWVTFTMWMGDSGVALSVEERGTRLKAWGEGEWEIVAELLNG